MIRSPHRAFTLVEIMIVVAIIGVVVGIALPAFLRAREVTRARACRANIGQINAAIGFYASDNKIRGGEPVSFDDLVLTGGTGYLRSVPRCPSGGDYTLTVIGEPVTCSEDHSAWDPDA